MKILNTQEFEKDVLESKKTVLVDFFAPWCGPCRTLAPILEDLSKEFEGKFDIYKVDIDQEANISQQYSIMNIPTLKFFRDGQPIETLIGLQPKSALKEKIEYYLAGNE